MCLRLHLCCSVAGPRLSGACCVKLVIFVYSTSIPSRLNNKKCEYDTYRRQKVKGAMEVSTKRKTNNVCPYSGETEYWVIIEKKGKEKQLSKDSSFVCVGLDASGAADMLTDAGTGGMWGGGGSSFLGPAAPDPDSASANKGGKGSRGFRAQQQTAE